MKFRTYEPGSADVGAREIGRKSYKNKPAYREFASPMLRIGHIYVAQDSIHSPGYAASSDVPCALTFGRIS